MLLHLSTNICVIDFCDLLCFIRKEPAFSWNYFVLFPDYIYATVYAMGLFTELAVESSLNTEIALHLKMLFQTLSNPVPLVWIVPFFFQPNFCSLLINFVSFPTANFSDNFRMCIVFYPVGVQLFTFTCLQVCHDF